MNNIVMFIYRDFLEFKNRPTKLLPTFISIIFPLLGLYSNNGLIANKQYLTILMTLIAPIYISMETTLSQTSSYIKEGIFEQYFLNKRIKKHQIIISKWIINSILSLVSYMFSFLAYMLIKSGGQLSTEISTDLTLIICIIMVCYVSSAVGIIAATLIKNEKAHFSYVMCMSLILMLIFVVFDKCGNYSELILIIYLVIISVIGTLFIQLLYKSNRFINRDK